MMPDLIIDDSTNNDVLFPAGMGTGRMARDYTNMPRGSPDYLYLADYPLIPRSEWSARIKEMEETKSRLSDIWHAHGCTFANQGQTNYCWMHGPVNACIALRASNNLPFVKLSGCAGAAIIKNFRNEGGWGTEAIKWIAEHGITTEALWPAATIDRKYATPEMEADALTRRVTEWDDLRPRNFDVLMTQLFNRRPTAVGFDYWGHEVCALDPVEIEPGSFGARIVNSWTNWGDRGMAALRESKATPDDAVSPRVINVTSN